jgi:hypothetical protein
VRQGQEFQVYHPDFSGGIPFMFSDGRTIKRLGTYPKLPSGQIVAFKVDPEISFCRVTNQVRTGLFPKDSRLEAVPVGSITHLILESGAPVEYAGREVARLSDLEGLVERIIQRKKLPTVIDVSLQNVNEIVEKRGTATVNAILADVYKALVRALPRSSLVGQVQTTEILAVWEKQPAPSPVYGATNANAVPSLDDGILYVINEVRAKWHDLPKITVGMVADEDYSKANLNGDRTRISPQRAIDAARYAARVVAGQGNQLVHFGPRIAAEILYEARKGELHDQVLRDYEAFRELGVEYANVENQAGLSYFAIDRADLAIERFTSAVELRPADPILVANRAYASFAIGDRQRAYDDFKQALDLWRRQTPPGQLPEVYISPLAMSMYEKYKSSQAQEDKELAIHWLEKARNAGTVLGIKREDIINAFAELTAVDH